MSMKRVLVGVLAFGMTSGFVLLDDALAARVRDDMAARRVFLDADACAKGDKAKEKELEEEEARKGKGKGQQAPQPAGRGKNAEPAPRGKNALEPAPRGGKNAPESLVAPRG